MVSKQLESIIATIPSATVIPATTTNLINGNTKKQEKNVRVVAGVPECVKNELQEKARISGETERTIILKALMNYGFSSVEDDMLVDRRSTR